MILFESLAELTDTARSVSASDIQQSISQSSNRNVSYGTRHGLVGGWHGPPLYRPLIVYICLSVYLSALLANKRVHTSDVNRRTYCGG